jgi:hypothetical protein
MRYVYLGMKKSARGASNVSPSVLQRSRSAGGDEV